jgi:hypothetical protein
LLEKHSFASAHDADLHFVSVATHS